MSHSKIAIALFCSSLALGACASGGTTTSSPSSSTASSSRSAPSTPMVEVTANSLNVRQQPSTSGAVVGSLKRGERAAAPQGDAGGWTYVQSSSGVSGYVSSKYVRSVAVTPSSPPPAAPAAAQAAAQAAGEAKPDYTPKPGSKLAQIAPGMTSAQVVEILGAPTSEQNYITGKAFIPYYYGNDTSRMAYHYTGLGRVVFSRNRWSGGLKVVEVHEDPSEGGH